MSSSNDSTSFHDDSSLDSAMSWQTIASNSSDIMNVAITIVVANNIFNGTAPAAPASRPHKTIIVRTMWDEFWARKLTDRNFEQTIRMSRESFIKLTNLLRESLQVDSPMGALRGGAIEPEVSVYCTIRYLGGGNWSDIIEVMGISKSKFYAIIMKTMKAIIGCPALDIIFPTTLVDCQKLSSAFQSISPKQCIINCVGAVDGYLLSIDVPNTKEAGNVRSYFSGHYQRYGINIQACCDANSRFTYFEIAGPGSANDRFAIQEKNCMGISLSATIEGLPPGYVVIGDPAYECTEHLVSLFYGNQKRNLLNNNFNYAASCCRIRIEMAFGLMNTKWCILNRPLKQPLRHIKYIAYAIARLHNYCISERLLHNGLEWEIFVPHTPTIPNEHIGNNNLGPEFPAVVGGAENEYISTSNVSHVSVVRLSMAREVRRCDVERPTSSVIHPGRIAEI